MASWIILRYQNISWETTDWTRSLAGLICPPDVFADHLQQVRRLGEIVPIRDGLRRLLAAPVTEPMFSIWFDGGFRDVRRYALPLLEECNAKAALSVSSRFLQRREMWWVMELAFLRSVNGLDRLHERLGVPPRASLLESTLQAFSPEVVQEIHATYMRVSSGLQRKDGFRIFETPDGLQQLYHHGWTIANQTAAGYPVGMAHTEGQLREQFEECESELEALLQTSSQFWVLPFDCPERRSRLLGETFQGCAEDRLLVLMNQEANQASHAAAGVLCRVDPPLVRGKRFGRYLKRLIKKTPKTTP